MPKRVHNTLTAARVRTAGEGVYTDGNGLQFRVDQHGRRWIHRMTVNGRRRNIGLGSYPAVSLKDAREMALGNLHIIQQGGDPLEEKRQRRAEAMRRPVPTFAGAAELVIDKIKGQWTSDRHEAQWRESLRLHAYPYIGNMPVDAVTIQDIKHMVEPIWMAKAETARRVLQRTRTIFDHVVIDGWRDDNPASTSIARVLGRRPPPQKHKALPYDEVPEALVRVRQGTGNASVKLSFEFLTLTAARSNEVRGMMWSEVDFEAETWMVPASRMKTRIEHRVPLSDRAMEILREARKLHDGELVFPNQRTGKPLSNMTYKRMLRQAKVDCVTHGMRSSMRSFALEQTDAPFAVAEAALAHTVGDGVASRYIRVDLFDKRRELMQQWADHCVLST